MCPYCLSFVYNSFPSHDELIIYICLQNIGQGQYKSRKVGRPNHDFCHFVVDFNNSSLGAG